MTKKKVKKEEILNPEPKGITEEIIEDVEEVEEDKPKKKREVSEATREHLAKIRVKALEVKQQKKLLREKAKALETVELELKAQKYDKTVIESNKLKTQPKKEVVEEVEEVEIVEEVKKPKKVKKIIKKIIEQSESSESEEEIIEEVIIKKSNNNKNKSNNNNNKSLSNNEKVQIIEQTTQEKLKESLKNDRINYLLQQIGARL